MRFVRNGAYDAQGTRLGWNATGTEDRYCEHMSCGQWGWNARQHSGEYLAYEFSQAKIGEPITDPQIEMFVHWFYSRAKARWRDLPFVFICHSELPAGITDGKSDAARRGNEADSLRQRILERLG